MRVLFAGGGTASHINPRWRRRVSGKRAGRADPVRRQQGRRHGERLVPAAGFKFRTIRISGFQRKALPQEHQGNAQTVVAVSRRSHKKVIKVSADICVGTGGYMSADPVIRAAQTRHPDRDPRAERVSGRHDEDAREARRLRDARRGGRKNTSSARITAFSPETQWHLGAEG